MPFLSDVPRLKQRLVRRRRMAMSPVASLLERLFGSAVLWITAADISGEAGQQSLPNRNGSGVAVRGLVRGAEITADGLYQPGTGGNQVVCPSAVVGIADATTTSIRLRRNVLSASGTPLIYIVGSSPRRIIPQASNATMHISLYTLGGAQRLENVPLAGAIYMYGLRYDITWDANGPNIPHVEFWYQPTEQDDWLHAGSDDWVDEISRPNNTELITISNNSEIVQHEFEIINDGASAVLADFRAQTVGAPSFDDAQGNEWTVNSTGADVNDPAFDNFDGKKYISFPRVNSSLVRGVVDLQAAGATDTSYTLLRKTVDVSVSNVEYVFLHGYPNRFYVLFPTGVNTAQFTLSRASDGVATLGLVVHPNIRARKGVRWRILWNHNGPNIPRLVVDYNDSGLDSGWVEAGWFDWVDEMARPVGPLTTYFGHNIVVPITGDVYSISLARNGVEVAAMNPDRDHKESDSFDSWTDSTSGETMTISNTAGNARLVTAKQISFDGVGNFLQTEFTPTVQKDSGAFGWKFDGSIDPASRDFGRIGSAEPLGGVGWFVYTSADGYLIVLFGTTGNYAVLADTSSNYRDGERFQVVTVIDGDAGLMRMATSRGYSAEVPLNPLSGAIAHNPVRLMSHGYTAAGVKGTVFDSWAWDQSFTEAEMVEMVS